MKKNIFPVLWTTLFVCCMLFVSKCHASVFGIDGTLFKNEMDQSHKEFAAIKVQGDISAAKIDKLQISLSSIVQGQADVTAGVNKSIKAMGDVIQNTNTTNDTGLMKAIIAGLVTLCSTLIGILGWCLKTLIKQGQEKKYYKEKVLLRVKDEDGLRALKQEQEEYIKTKGYRKNK